MLSASTVPCGVTRACGHRETVNITARHARERSDEQSLLATMVCSNCAKKIEALFLNRGEEIHEIAFPELRGTDRQVAWAKKLRDKRWAIFGAMLNQVVQSNRSDPIILPLYKALLAYGSMESAQFWIDTREFEPSFWGIKRDAEFFMREPRYGTVLGDFSPYARLKKFNPVVMNRLKNAQLPDLRPAENAQAV